jgi:hypothetical protein
LEDAWFKKNYGQYGINTLYHAISYIGTRFSMLDKRNKLYKIESKKLLDSFEKFKKVIYPVERIKYVYHRVYVMPLLENILSLEQDEEMKTSILVELWNIKVFKE